MEKALAACAGMPAGTLDHAALRSYVAEKSRDITQAQICGLLLKQGETYVLANFCGDEPNSASQTRAAVPRGGAENPVHAALISQARDFALQANQQKGNVEFRLGSEIRAESVFYGLAHPLATVQSAMVIVLLKKARFSADEIAALEFLTKTARLALENIELTALASAQQQHLNQLLAISTELGATSQLDGFLSRFVVRAAEFLGFERVFVALVESGKCHVRWGSINGVANPLDIDFSTAGTRRILESRETYLTEDINEFPPLDKKAEETRSTSKVKQYVGVPLLTSDGRSLGILGLLDKKDGNKVGESDVARAKALAAELAVALEAAHNLHLSEQHRKRAENLMEMALELGSALRLPEFVKNFTARVANIMQARSAILALSQGTRLEAVGFYGIKLERNQQRKLNAALSQYAEKHPDLKITGSGVPALGKEVTDSLGWENLALVRLEGTEGDLVGVLCLADISKELLPNDLNLLQALIGHASVALENSRLFTRITQSSRQWAEIFDSITDFIVVHDEQNRVLRVNRSLAEFIGVRPAELIGLSMRALISLSPDTVQPCPFCRSETGSDEYLHPSLERTYLVSTSRVHGAINEGLQTIHVLKDITDRREAERRYRELFDNVQEGVFFASNDGRFIEVNDALVRMLGYQHRDELLKLDPDTQVYLSTDQRDQIIKQLNEHGAIQNFEVSLRRRDGTLIHALENAFVVRDAQGKILQYRGVLLDITEVKNFQAQLQRERDFTGKILNNTQTMIMVADTAGLISYANRRCYEAGAFDPQELLGNRLDKVIPTQTKEFSEAFESSLHGQHVDNLEISITRSNGSQGKFSVNLSPMRDEAGDVTSVVVLMTDITDTAMIQAKLMHTEKMAAVGQLVSGVAHEVNNPLTAIMGFSDLLMENPDLPDSARKDLKVILEESHRTREIVKNLLSFARQRPPQRQSLQVNTLLERTVALRAYDLANSAIEVVEKFDDNIPALVGDAHQLQQVFLNILNNAFDAVRGVGRPGQIEIETRQQQDWIEISFRDNGEGIKYPERIFDPFFTTKEVGKGTGLGLSICYGIVREHEGEILCSNNKETPGATFVVRLPVHAKSGQKMVTATRGQA
jgi:two-component system NtrC family sensor kinase